MHDAYTEYRVVPGCRVRARVHVCILLPVYMYAVHFISLSFRFSFQVVLVSFRFVSFRSGCPNPDRMSWRTNNFLSGHVSDCCFQFVVHNRGGWSAMNLRLMSAST